MSSAAFAANECGKCDTAKAAKPACTKASCDDTSKPAKSAGTCSATKVAVASKSGKACGAKGTGYAKFKVFVDGNYMFYGCQGSATKARKEMMPVAFKVGQVQKVAGKVAMPKNQQLMAIAR